MYGIGKKGLKGRDGRTNGVHELNPLGRGGRRGAEEGRLDRRQELARRDHRFLRLGLRRRKPYQGKRRERRNKPFLASRRVRERLSRGVI